MKFLRWELRHTADPTCRRVFGGGGGESSSNSPQTTNTDRRMAVQGGSVATEGSTAIFNDSSTTYAADAEVLKTLAQSMPDAVKAMTNAGADVIERAGGAVVNMNRDSIAANSKSFDSVVNFGAQAIDRLIDASTQNAQTGNALASQAVAAFTPTENKNADAMKWGLIAAAGAVALVIMGKTK